MAKIRCFFSGHDEKPCWGPLEYECQRVVRCQGHRNAWLNGQDGKPYYFDAQHGYRLDVGYLPEPEPPRSPEPAKCDWGGKPCWGKVREKFRGFSSGLPYYACEGHWGMRDGNPYLPEPEPSRTPEPPEDEQHCFLDGSRSGPCWGKLSPASGSGDWSVCQGHGGKALYTPEPTPPVDPRTASAFGPRVMTDEQQDFDRREAERLDAEVARDIESVREAMAAEARQDVGPRAAHDPYRVCSGCSKEILKPDYFNVSYALCYPCEVANADKKRARKPMASAHAFLQWHPRKPKPRTILYCENAPPEEVVLAAGLVFSERMRGEWLRHEAHDPKTRLERETLGPYELDVYGGCVAQSNFRDMRCCLCGGWIRTREVKR